MVATVLFGRDDHVSASELVDACRERDAGIGTVTVHRTLVLLQEAGLVERHELPDRAPVYEIMDEHHDHLVCVGCGTVIEFHDEAIERRQADVASRLGFRIVAPCRARSG